MVIRNEQPKITLVELPPTSFGKLNGEKVKDIYVGFGLPPRASPQLHAILLQNGYEDVESIDPNLNKDCKLSKNNFSRIFESNYVLLSSITRTIPQTKQLALLYKKENPRGKVIGGGYHASFLPKETLEWADVVVRREGEKTLLQLLEALETTGLAKGVEGISYKENGNILHEPDRKLLTPEEFSQLPIPYVKGNYRIGVVITSRGCPYNCNFCSVVPFNRGVYRRRTNDSILDELRKSKFSKIFFADDNFDVNKRKTIELLERMVAEGLNDREYYFQLSVNSAFVSLRNNTIDWNFIKSLKKAGGFSVFLGLESMNEEILREYGKTATVERNNLAVKAFRDVGLWLHGMMIVGADGDTSKSLDDVSLWANKNLDSVQYFALNPLPETPLTKKMEEQGRILSKDYYLYDGFHVLIKPKNLSPYELQLRLIDMHKHFYSFSSMWKHAKDSPHPWYKRIIHPYALKTIYDIEHEPQTKQHFEFLREIS